MGYSKIRPRRDIKANWERANPILLEGEVGYEFETAIGVGQAKIKMGDGHTNWNSLGYAIIDDITDKTVKNIDNIITETPTFSNGEKLKTIFGKIKKYLSDLLKKITTINTTIGQFKNVSVNNVVTSNITDAITRLDVGKLSTSNVYNGLDSSNTALALSAPAGKQLKQMCDNNSNGINQLNSDLAIGKNGLLRAAKFWRTNDSCNVDFECTDNVLRQIIYNTTDNSLVGVIGGIATLYIAVHGITGIECYYDPATDFVVLRWLIDSTHQRQLAVRHDGINYDRWDGGDWYNVWHINVN